MYIDVSGSPYLLPTGDGYQALRSTLRSLDERIELLRSEGRLSEATLRDYYGMTRFQQIAESNALEGSTLSIGETELAVLKGITISGHDPGFSRDAQSLARALDRLAEMARQDTPTDIEQLLELHELILEGRPSAGSFRRAEVRIRGSAHTPPRSWSEVMTQMEHWEEWSRTNSAAPPILRAAVLHAWLVHVHPFSDGNGRSGRAIMNLDLVRSGYPPVIIRHKDRDQYLDALARADEGDLGPFLDMIATRLDDALLALERAAQRKQGYDAVRLRLRKFQEGRLAVWNAGVHLLATQVESLLTEHLSDSAALIEVKEYAQLSVDDFIELCEKRPVRMSWAFRVRLRVQGGPLVERLAWASLPGDPLRSYVVDYPPNPVIKWSVPNPGGYPPWTVAGRLSPGGEEMTIVRDRWSLVRGGRVLDESPSELAGKIVQDLIDQAMSL